MVTVGMNYEVLPGKGEPFEKMFAKLLEVMNGMAGHKSSHLYRDVANQNSYLIISEWSDKAAFDAFTSSDRFRGVTNWGKEQILAARPKHEIYGLENTASTTPPSACPMHGR